MRQLSGTDSLMLHSDRPHAQNLIAPLGIYDPSTAPGGEVSFDDVLRFIESRLDISDSFRDRLVGVPLDLDRPWWVRDADFDLEYHVRQIALPKRGDWPQFCSQIARLGARPLDLARPPWELYIIEGLDGIDDVPAGSFAMMLKLHHAAVDGVSGAEMVTALHDSAPDATRSTTPSSWQPEPVPSNLALLGQAWLHSVTRPLAFLGQVVPQLRSVPGAIRQAGARPGGGAVVTATRFNGPVSPHRVWGATRLTLAEMKQVRAAVPDAKVNDVALALVGGALRAYLDDKGELPEESLVAIMPISVRPTMTQRRGAPEVEAAAGGNRFGMANVAMFTQLDDPIERVRAIREATAAAKSTGAMGAASLVQISELLPGALMGSVQRAVTRTANRAGRAVGAHTVVTNVPGPQVPVYFCGARAVFMSGMAPVTDGMGIIHGIGSYAGEVPVCFSADREMMPDPGFYETCIRNAMDDLLAGAGAITPVA